MRMPSPSRSKVMEITVFTPFVPPGFYKTWSFPTDIDKLPWLKFNPDFFRLDKGIVDLKYYRGVSVLPVYQSGESCYSYDGQARLTGSNFHHLKQLKWVAHTFNSFFLQPVCVHAFIAHFVARCCNNKDVAPGFTQARNCHDLELRTGVRRAAMWFRDVWGTSQLHYVNVQISSACGGQLRVIKSAVQIRWDVDHGCGKDRFRSRKAHVLWHHPTFS